MEVPLLNWFGWLSRQFCAHLLRPVRRNGSISRHFAQAERRARALVRRQKQERLFGQFIIQLRHEYAAQIEVFRTQVEALVRNT